MAFSKAFLHNAVKQLIPQLRDQYDSGNKALQFLKAEGIGIERQSFYRYWGEIGTATDKADRLKFINYDKKPSDSLVGYYDQKIQNRYQVIAKVDYTDSVSGEVTDKKISFLTPSLKTRGEMEDLLLDIAIDESSDYGIGAVSKIQLIEIRSSDKYFME